MCEKPKVFKYYFYVFLWNVSSFKELVLCVGVKNASEIDNVKTRIIFISIIIIRTRNNLIFRRLGQDWFVSKTSCGHSYDPWVVAGSDQARTTSDPLDDAGDRSELAKIDKIQRRTIGGRGGETAPHPGNKDKSCERDKKKPEFGVGSKVSSFYLTTSSRKISYDVGDCLARTGTIRAENLSNVLLSGETGWTHRTDESE